MSSPIAASPAGRERVSTGPRFEPAHVFYRQILDLLEASKVPFLVGGAYAFERYTGIDRHSCDFDVFVLPEDARRVLDLCKRSGYRTRLTHPHWLGKIHHGRDYVDIIYSSGNGVARVDQVWFDHAPEAEVLGHRVRLCPVEEMIWSKGFIQERERFDGADIMHLIHATGRELDWRRLLERFGPHWEVLLAHLVLFGFVYPAERDRIPPPVMKELQDRLGREPERGAEGPICRGTMLSRNQYLPDLARGYEDPRLVEGIMSREDIARWTAAAKSRPRATSPDPGATPRRSRATAARTPRRGRGPNAR